MAIYWCEQCQSYSDFLWNGVIPVCECCKEKRESQKNIYAIYYEYLEDKGLEVEFNNFIMEYSQEEITEILKRNDYI